MKTRLNSHSMKMTQFREMWERGDFAQDIARKLGYKNNQSVAATARSLGLASRAKLRLAWTKSELEELTRLWAKGDGATIQELAANFNRSSTEINHQINILRLPRKRLLGGTGPWGGITTQSPKVQANGHERLTHPDVDPELNRVYTRECRWVVKDDWKYGDKGDPWCNEETVPGKDYCPCHQEKMHTALPKAKGTSMVFGPASSLIR